MEFRNDDCSGGSSDQFRAVHRAGPASITLKDLVRATRRPPTAKQSTHQQISELMHKPGERANELGV